MKRSIKTQIYAQHTDYQPYKQLEFVCMAGVLWSKIAEYVCVKYNICPDKKEVCRNDADLKGPVITALFFSADAVQAVSEGEVTYSG